MKKEKGTTYLLICAVAVVWGIIFYRVFSGMAAEDIGPIPQQAVKKTYFNLVDHARDTVILDLSYSDPFSKGYTAVAAENVLTEQPILTRPTPVLAKPRTDWSGIVYIGQLYNAAQCRHVAIINVKGREIMLTEGQSGGELKFIRRVGDSVKVEYGGESRYLSIK
ncbi:hypothetical protein ACS5PU_02185 [Pedobacter sp. GSP4]|uniref:hypothetical protein n=1 Tax=Pedobacter sp. GSP4 TaxID=3453716 RepID=UPI003EE969C1